MLKLAYF